MLIETTCVWCRIPIFRYANDTNFICQKCSERKNMVQTKTLKITAEVDGKVVPLNTISTESFEAIKALEKQGEIPVARLANYSYNESELRLLFRPTENIQLKVGKIYSLDLRRGIMSSNWEPDNDEYAIKNTYPTGTREL